MPQLRPYVAAVVRPIPVTTRDERIAALDDAGHNPFYIPATMVSIDLLSDSGTGALSQQQQAWAALADERYAFAESFTRFDHAVREIVPYPYVFPVHQGRAAERVLCGSLLSRGQISVSNTHFDTTSANIALLGCYSVDLPCPEAVDLDSDHPFKGNIDLDGLNTLLRGPDGPRVGQILITMTNNGMGGQPVSMSNLDAVSQIARDHGIPLILDAARMAENAWLVRRREAGYEDWTPRDIARRAFEFADGCVASLKKDGLGHAGGFLAVRDESLAQQCEATITATEGHRTYGGMAGHSLEVVAQGLREAFDPHYLADRETDAAYLAEQIHAAGVDTVRPAGMHAVYLNASRVLPHLQPHHFPAHALACALYREGGIRAAEMGSLYLGGLDEHNNLVTPAPFELVRLALPRRVYDHSHLEYIGEILVDIAKNPERVTGYQIVEAPRILRHFKCVTAPLDQHGA
ncbi:tryptophanase [Saccharopolyspora sp. K220]|uniref:tryptophanase n=1 Tax=Saccharopolyspora soli TaxID=2926618 RepID=UPI001F56E4E3|nr:tryptophanase [Saccharopolyspora soli]MCI2421069.1 tryptophanase [Saccharopolyspora soli]